MFRKFIFVCSLLSFVLIFLSSSNPTLADTVTFEWATVGNPGNAADTTSYGSVGNTYRISKHEVTNAQYTTFLNAVAATDSNGLYSSFMGNSSAAGGITQSGASGSFSYSVKTNMGNKPVNFVSYFDAMRFTNWLQNGQGSGSTESGVYTIGSGTDEVRQAGAKYFIPSEDEWYKAAYHKNDGVTGNYWDYPTSSDTVPNIATADAFGNISNPSLNVANYEGGADWNGLNGNVTTVGSATSLSPYGTLDQGGNLQEWNEGVEFRSGTERRVIRGGSYSNPSTVLAASRRNINGVPSVEINNVGFRVASSVPEPSSLLIGALGTIGLLLRRRR